MKKFKMQKAYLLFALILGVFITLPGCSGSEGGGGEWNQPVAHTTPIAPTVTAVTPLAGAAAVPINTKLITAAFSTAMIPTTLNTTTFRLSCNGIQVTGGGAVTYVEAGHVATLPLPGATNLPIVAECTATITTGAKNTAGTALASNYVWTFTTGSAMDTARPVVTLTVPATTVPGPTLDVPANTAITAIFNEDMNPITITEGSTFTLTGPGVTPVVGMAIPVTYNVASRTATFRPLEELTPGTTYTATIKGTGVGAAADLANNALAGDPALPLVANDYVWTFTATDPVLPQPVSVLPLTVRPAADAIDACPTTTVKATFDVPSGLRMDPDTINSGTFTVTESLAPFTPVDAATVSLDPGTGTIATFTPLNPLSDGTTYTATIKGGPTGVKDMVIPTANEMTNDYTWDFTAGPATGVCQPLVNPGVLASFGIASAGGLTNSGATTINGDVVLNPNFFCNDEPVGEANDFGLCGGTPPINNAGDMVITQTYPDTTTADAVRAALLVKWGNISPAQTPGATVLGCGTIGTTGGAGAGIGCDANSTLPPGAYISASNSTIVVDGVLTLDGQGNPDAVFIFQAPSALTTSVNSQIVLMGQAKASNVWWYVGSDATINGGTIFNGNVLASGAISMGTLATSCGRLLSGAEGAGAFTFLANTVSVPGHPFAPVGCE